MGGWEIVQQIAYICDIWMPTEKINSTDVLMWLVLSRIQKPALRTRKTQFSHVKKEKLD